MSAKTTKSAKKRNRIRACYKDYLKTLAEEEKDRYLRETVPLAGIINTSDGDVEVLARARAYDAEHGTDFFSLAVDFTIYCLACHRVDCIC
ncbi:MAG: hypothetical protein L3J03_02920 [Desulfobacterales bacterium]|nr:hypothetical protein [Desulfobacterales bacterium]